MTVTADQCDILRLEHTRVAMTIKTTKRGDMSIHIISPAGTDSEILSPRPDDKFEGGEYGVFLNRGGGRGGGLVC